MRWFEITDVWINVELFKITEKYNGVEGLCKLLKTDPINGLPNDKVELDRRRLVYGKNEIPPAPSKSFIRLAWEALQVCFCST